jgi:hypothetical protein
LSHFIQGKKFLSFVSEEDDGFLGYVMTVNIYSIQLNGKMLVNDDTENQVR